LKSNENRFFGDVLEKIKLCLLSKNLLKIIDYIHCQSRTIHGIEMKYGYGYKGVLALQKTMVAQLTLDAFEYTY
jgi:hypothetical protein